MTEQPEVDIPALFDLLSLHGVKWSHLPSQGEWIMVARPGQVPRELLEQAHQHWHALTTYASINAPSGALTPEGMALEQEILHAIQDELDGVDSIGFSLGPPPEGE